MKAIFQKDCEWQEGMDLEVVHDEPVDNNIVFFINENSGSKNHIVLNLENAKELALAILKIK